MDRGDLEEVLANRADRPIPNGIGAAECCKSAVRLDFALLQSLACSPCQGGMPPSYGCLAFSE